MNLRSGAQLLPSRFDDGYNLGVVCLILTTFAPYVGVPLAVIALRRSNVVGTESEPARWAIHLGVAQLILLVAAPILFAVTAPLQFL